jgi:hypothetical protein
MQMEPHDGVDLFDTLSNPEISEIIDSLHEYIEFGKDLPVLFYDKEGEKLCRFQRIIGLCLEEDTILRIWGVNSIESKLIIKYDLRKKRVLEFH